jgi:hypothetical protein
LAASVVKPREVRHILSEEVLRPHALLRGLDRLEI